VLFHCALASLIQKKGDASPATAAAEEALIRLLLSSLGVLDSEIEVFCVDFILFTSDMLISPGLKRKKSFV
jgi:hypothetical protein